MVLHHDYSNKERLQYSFLKGTQRDDSDAEFVIAGIEFRGMDKSLSSKLRLASKISSSDQAVDDGADRGRFLHVASIGLMLRNL